MLNNKNTKFKETEIGPIPREWDLLTIGDVAESISDTFKFTNNDVIFLNTGDILEGKILHSEKTNPKLLPGQAKKKIKKEDILYSEIRPANKRFALVNFDPSDHVVSTKLMVLRAKEAISPRYLYTHLTSPQILNEFQVLAESRSGTFPQITFDAISKALLLLPPKPEQERIADFIFDLNDKIELNRAMNVNLEKIASTLFKHWFVDIGDELPKGWRMEPLSSFGQIICGKTPSKSIKEYFDGDVPFIKIPDMHGNIYIIKTEDSLTESGVNSQKKKIVPAGSICVSCIATVGLVSMTTTNSQTNQQINSIVPSKSFYQFYLFYTLKKLSEYLQSMGSSGSATLNVNTKSFSSIEILKPDDGTLKKFDILVRPIFDRIKINIEESLTLSRVRDSLLPRLMSGKIRVNIHPSPTDELLAYLDNVNKKTDDVRLVNPEIRQEIVGLVDKAANITHLATADLLVGVDFKPQNLTFEALESLLAELRSIFWLRDFGFINIIPLKAKKKVAQPDFTANYEGKTCAIEVFCLTEAHGQKRSPGMNVYVNFDPQFPGSKFGRDFMSAANTKKQQLDSINCDLKILLCVINSQPVINLNTAEEMRAHAKFLYEQLAWNNNYYVGLLTGALVNGEKSDTIYPALK